jgi:peptidoglycan/LPS O-acetylase OafA/YrhL
MVVFLGLGRRFLNFNHPVLQYMSEASLPFYILHQPIILVIGFWMADWKVGVLMKFMALSSIACVMIALFYELLVRRIGLLRISFGLKPI